MLWIASHLSALYAQAELGFSVVSAGALASPFGIAGLTARLIVPPFAMRSRHIAIPMVILAAMALIGCFLLWMSPSLGPAAPWVGSSLVGGLSAWTALGMLSVITRVDQADSGAASGLVTRGYTLGTALGPILFGFLLSRTGEYDLTLLLVGLSISGSAVLMLSWLRSEGFLSPN